MTTEFPLWPTPAPLSLGDRPHDIPTLTPFIPEYSGTAEKSPAIIICPGGGYEHLADHEGELYARWFRKHGVAAFVLKYRLAPPYRHPAMLLDAARALRLVRARAAEWNLDPHRLGIIGCSAGGHLAATLMTHFDAGDPTHADPVEHHSSRPDFGILCYPVISMGPHTHEGSRDNLLGLNPDPDLIDLLSNEKQVTSDTPPAFIWHTWEDGAVKVENALDFATALRAHTVPFELHVYESGPHGIGLGEGGPTGFHRWTDDCLAWLHERGYAPKP